MSYLFCIVGLFGVRSDRREAKCPKQAYNTNIYLCPHPASPSSLIVVLVVVVLVVLVSFRPSSVVLPHCPPEGACERAAGGKNQAALSILCNDNDKTPTRPRLDRRLSAAIDRRAARGHPPPLVPSGRERSASVRTGASPRTASAGSNGEFSIAQFIARWQDALTSLGVALEFRVVDVFETCDLSLRSPWKD